MDDNSPKTSWDETLQFDTIENIVDKFKRLTNWILFSTKLGLESASKQMEFSYLSLFHVLDSDWAYFTAV